tara:strand:+ start:4855 stop:5337 length:483 start_codon:yes stop_codon:yes gene_type:complete
MFEVFEGIVTPAEAKELKDMGQLNHSISDFSGQIVNKMAKAYQSLVDQHELLLESPSYWRVESLPRGHGWHFDGCKLVDGAFVDNHMAWCNYGTTALLSKPGTFKNGRLFFEINGEPFEVEDHYLNGVIYPAGKFNNPLKHMVEKHDGKRYSLLMFFAIR